MNSDVTLINHLYVILPNTILEFANNNNISLEKARNFMYGSKLYKALEDDNKKMWYYSSKYLADFLTEEYEKGEYTI